MQVRINNLILLSLIFFAVNPIFAQDSTFSLGGFFQYDHISYFNDIDQKVNNRNEGLIQLKLSSKFTKTSHFGAVAELREDISDTRRNRIWIDELILKQSLGMFDITLGKQLISWGTADGINPVNTINPVDYSDLLDTEDERIGVYGLRCQLFLSGFDMDLFWSPFPTTGIFPDTDSRWFPSLLSMGIPPELITTGIQAEIADQKPELKLEDGEIGLRLRKRFSGFDLAASYYTGYDHLPEYLTDTSELFAEEPRLLFLTDYHRQQVLGIEMAIALPGGFGLRNETALFIPEEATGGRTSYVQTIIGIDRSFTPGSSTLLFILQYMYDYNLDGQSYESLDLRHVFSNAIFTNIELSLVNGLSLNNVLIIKLENKDYLLRSELAYHSPAGLRFSLAADLLEGDARSFLGTYSGNDRIQCKFRYTF